VSVIVLVLDVDLVQVGMRMVVLIVGVGMLKMVVLVAEVGVRVILRPMGVGVRRFVIMLFSHATVSFTGWCVTCEARSELAPPTVT
jgi:hypothetical protein